MVGCYTKSQLRTRCIQKWTFSNVEICNNNLIVGMGKSKATN